MLFFTICARNYLAFALTLRDSVVRADPTARFVIFIADSTEGTQTLGADIVGIDALAIAPLRDMKLRYTLMELSTAIKPFCFKYLFEVRGEPRAVYLDPDIEVFAPLSAVTEAFDQGASCVVTPHLLEPLRDAMRPSDLDILRSGTFNLGFIAFARVPEAQAFLDWWAGHLQRNCLADLPRGLFVDQKFVEFAPSFLEHLNVLRHPGYNVAYWNLAHRPLTSAADHWRAGNAPLVFFHFSGIVPGDGAIVSRHQNRFDRRAIGASAALFDTYREKLNANNHAHWSKIPYAFDRFSDGSLIPAVIRRSDRVSLDSESGGQTYDRAYWNHPDPAIDQDEGALISRLMSAIHAARDDLQIAYPLSSRRGRHAFAAWFLAHGLTEFRLDPDMHLPNTVCGVPARRILPRWLARLLLRWR